MSRYHQRICDAFLKGEDVSEIVRQLAQHTPSINPGFAANFGFVALAYGLRDAREILTQVVRRLESPALATYNLALSALFAGPDGLTTAVDELRSVVASAADGKFEAMLLPRWNAGEVEFEEWRPGTEDTESRRLTWFVDTALEELEKALAAGGTPRIIPARGS
jgi:hypothetical protein